MRHCRPLKLALLLAFSVPLYSADIAAQAQSGTSQPSDVQQQSSPQAQQSAEESTLVVQIEGLSGELKQNVVNLLSIQRQHEKPIKSLSRIRYLHRRAEAEISRALQPFGYYRPVIQAALTQEKPRWIARYEIDAGPPLPIETTDIQVIGEGLEDAAFAKLLETTPVKPGGTLIHSQYEQLKSRLAALASERGYNEAQFERQRVEVDLTRYQASVELILNTGPRYRIGEIRFSDNPLSLSLLERYVPFETGDPLLSSQLRALQSALTDSDYFSQVEVRPLWEEATDQNVPIDVVLEPQKRTLYQAGVGFGTDTGARGKLGVTRRWVNDRGHQLNGELLVSQIRSSLSSSYIIPGARPQSDRYALRVGYSDESSDTIDARNATVGISWQQRKGLWQSVLALDWEQEDFAFGDDARSTQFLIPQISLTRVSTRDRLKVERGYRITLQLLGASEAALSDTDFVQGRVGIKGIYSLTPRLRLIARGEAGTTAISDFTQLPATHRFYAGGDNSVRGYDYKTLGPVNAEGDVIGGQHLMVGSLEAEYRLTQQWGLAIFADSGNAFDDFNEPLKTGLGVGVRWQSPVGPVRLDVATPLDDDDDAIRLHLTLGPDL